MNMKMDLRFLFNFSHMDFLLWRNSNRHPFPSVLVTYSALSAAMVALQWHFGRVAAPNMVRYGLEAWCSLCGACAVWCVSRSIDLPALGRRGMSSNGGKARPARQVSLSAPPCALPLPATAIRLLMQVHC